MSTLDASPLGLHRVLEPQGVLPQAAARLDPRPEIWPDEVRIDVETLNLDAASYRQLAEKHHGDGDAVRAEVLDIVATRGKMQNPVTGSGGMLVGTVAEVGPQSPLGLAVGDRVATLVSLSLTPLRITDGLERWDGHSEQVPASGHAILFGRSIAAVLPDDLDPRLALMVMDVCGAPASGRLGSSTRGRMRHARRSASWARPASPGRCPWPPPATRAPDGSSASSRTRPKPPPCVPRTSPTRSLSPMRVHPSACPKRSAEPADPPTSRSSASTSRDASSRPSSPRRTAARSCSSRWPRASRRRPSEPRGWPPTSPCSSATATSRGTPPTRSTCSAAYRPSVRCSRLRRRLRGPAGRSRRPRRGPGGSSTGPWPRRRRAGRSGRPG